MAIGYKILHGLTKECLYKILEKFGPNSPMNQILQRAKDYKPYFFVHSRKKELFDYRNELILSSLFVGF